MPMDRRGSSLAEASPPKVSLKLVRGVFTVAPVTAKGFQLQVPWIGGPNEVAGLERSVSFCMFSRSKIKRQGVTLGRK
jgi:hypothetical protein